MVSELLLDIWLDELGIDADLLSVEDRIQVEFIFSGLVAVLGSAEAGESPFAVSRLVASPMGRASMTVLRKMAAAQLGGKLE